jgi:hypothetical protein
VNISVTSSPTALSNTDPANTLEALLPTGYKLDSASPSTVNSNELLWQITQTTGNAQVEWDLTNLYAAGHASLWLFFSGILLAAAAGFLAVVLDRLGSH